MKHVVRCLPWLVILPGALCGWTAAEEIACPNGLTVDAGDWPWWRGPTLDGKAVGPQPPTKWSETQNVIWRASIPGLGHASPCIWGDRIFIATAEGKPGESTTRKGITVVHPSGSQEVQSLLCFDRATGKQRWRTDVHRGGFTTRHAKNSHATATPACDGQQVFVVFANHDKVWLTALDLDGKIAWQKELGGIEGRYGYGASPLLCKSLVIVNVDHPGGGYIKALDRATGRQVWQAGRDKWYGFASPIVAPLAGRDQLLQSGVYALTSYEPSSGGVLWTCQAPSNTLAATPVCSEECVFVTGGDPQTGVRSIRADGRGDVTGSHVAWANTDKVYVPSSLLIDGRLVCVKDIGVAVCFDARSGKQLWEERLGAGDFSASPVALEDLVFVPNEAGRMFVFRAGRKFERVAENDLRDGGFATPVIAGGRLYLRTLDRLYCIGSR